MNEWTEDKYIDWFHAYQTSDWEKYIKIAEEENFPYKHKSILQSMLEAAQKRQTPQMGSLRFAKRIIDAIEKEIEREEVSGEVAKSNNFQKTSHITCRLAWHDNKWNGRICKNPESNHYCTGYHSLLSSRLRDRKRTDIESAYAEKSIGELLSKRDEDSNRPYIPPCFWSINTFGDENAKIWHDNPAAPELKPISENLSPHSIFSWPFALSFNRTDAQSITDGKYPRHLKENRIDRFQDKIKEGESLAFLYCNYDHPFSDGEFIGERYKYLLIGVSKIRKKHAYTEFSEPHGTLDKIRARGKEYENFPDVNWALQYTLSKPEDTISLPYHEYLDVASGKSSRDILNKIKLTIDEPELEHCFKYVAMDITDDDAIFLLTKLKYKFLEIRDDGIVLPSIIDNQVNQIDILLGECWNKRGYYPGISNLIRVIQGLGRYENSRLIKFLEQNMKADPYLFPELLENLLSNPSEIEDSQIQGLVDELLQAIEAQRIDAKVVLRLAMLDLKVKQFKRMFFFELGDENLNGPTEISDNPYLLYEEYQADWDTLDNNTGESIDGPIPLYKIDLAYLPDTEFMDPRPSQRFMGYFDQRRIRALLIDHLRGLEQYGDCFNEDQSAIKALNNNPLLYRLGKHTKLPPHFFRNIPPEDFAILSEKLEIREGNDRIYFYLRDVYSAETSISNHIQALLAQPDHDTVWKGTEEYIANSVEELRQPENIGDRFNIEGFRAERRHLFCHALKKHFFVITGSPGTGKSFELLRIIRILTGLNEKVLILTPTGKAAQRLNVEIRDTGLQAKTIDKILHDIKKRNHDISSFDNIILDEMSMVDLIKLNDLLHNLNVHNPKYKRLIFCGDKNQLPSIGYGKVLSDTLYYLQTHPDYSDNYVEMFANCRVESGESLLELASIYANQKEDYEGVITTLLDPDHVDESITVNYWSDENALNKLLDSEIKNLARDLGQPEPNAENCLDLIFGIQGKTIKAALKDKTLDLDSIQFLTPYRSDIGGVLNVNSFIQENYRSNNTLIRNSKHAFHDRDKILMLENLHYKGKLMLSNGSSGIVSAERKGGKVFFPDTLKEESSLGGFGEGTLELAYCLTIHKSQGSGFKRVVIILPEKTTLLSRELFYTAISRAKQHLTLLIQGKPGGVWQESIFENIRKRSFSETRKTTLFGLPFWDYTLEPEKGIMVHSRVEYIIYSTLLEYSKKYNGFTFYYEKKPQLEKSELPIKTDFTVITDTGNIYYWEHLGMLGDYEYSRTWKYKRKTYQKFKVENLVTTDETRGLNEDKLRSIIESMREGSITTEDSQHRYSQHHYYLR